MGMWVTERNRGSVEYQITLPPRGLGEELQALLRAFGRGQPIPATSSRDKLAAATRICNATQSHAKMAKRPAPRRGRGAVLLK